jgi:Family of unknown function (DUF6272)
MTKAIDHAAFLPNAEELGEAVVTFEGACTHDVVVQLAQELERSRGQVKGFKKMFGIFIELIQNVKNYSSLTEETSKGAVGIGIVRVGEKEAGFTVFAGNCIFASSMERIKSQCDTVRTLSHDELRAYYNERIKIGPPESSKGAGLGLIDIALKSNENVTFAFHTINEELVLFTVTAYIQKK